MSKLTFKEFLKEAPLPDDWDKSVYSHRNSFAKRINYAKEKAKRIGTGSSRVAFIIPYQGRQTVLKVAKNKKGMAQNAQEIEALNDWYLKGLEITIPMIDWDQEDEDNPTWLQTEFATKAKDSDFKKICGLSLRDLIVFCTKMSGRRDETHFYNSAWPEMPNGVDKDELSENEFIHDLTDYFSNYSHHPLGDYGEMRNWGVYNGRPVIIDIGLSKDILNMYYNGGKS